MAVLVEICCGSVDDVMEAENGRAQRVELCSALPLGGLTPSAGVIGETKRQSGLSAMVMIRPRAGGFCYSEADFASMERDIDLAGEFGADGFVFGVLLADGRIDDKRTKRLVDRAAGRPTVHHRAFDVTPEPFEALEAIIDLGFTRLLTSGQKASALEGAELLSQLIDRAGSRIEIMPGGGIRPHNIEEVVRRTGCRQVHLAAHRQLRDASTTGNPSISFGSDSPFSEERVDLIDQTVVAEVVAVATRL